MPFARHFAAQPWPSARGASSRRLGARAALGAAAPVLWRPGRRGRDERRDDPRLPAPLIRALGAAPDIGPDAVGDNEPYDGGLPGDTINAIATARGLANALIELRQDLIGERGAAEAWADRLARIVAPLAAPAAIRAPQDWGSRAEGRPRPRQPA